MQQHKEAQEGRVELDIGGYRFETSMQTLRRVPHTFFDAYFSGRYAQDVCADGSIFVDRNGEHFGHVLEYMCDGVVSVAVAESGANPSASLLRVLNREFNFHCIELSSELQQPGVSYVMGGNGDDGNSGPGLSSVDRYDASSGRWSAVADMIDGRYWFGVCTLSGSIYVTGGCNSADTRRSFAEKYSPSSDTWCAIADMPELCSENVAVAVGLDMYALGGRVFDDGYDDVESGVGTSSVLKYDSTQDTWTPVAPMPEATYDAAGCAVESDIFVDIAGNAQASVYKFDTKADN
jgi:hypothetical protein